MKQMNSKYRKILISTTVVALIVIAAAVYMGWNYQSMAAYNAKLAEADQLLVNEDYANAVLKYQEAIGDRPKEEEGYVKLFTAYRLVGHDDYALQTVEQALEIIPDSERLTELRNELIGAGKAVAVVLNVSSLDSLSAMSYHDLSKKNGIEKKSVMNDGSITVRVKGIDADLIYMNTSGQPKAVRGSSPAPESLPAYVQFDDIMSILGGGKSASYSELEKLELSKLDIDKHHEYGSAVTFEKGLYKFVIQSDEEGNISSSSENRVYIPDPSERAGGTAVKGRVIDAVTGNGVANVSLTFRSANGEEYETVSNNKGEFKTKAGPGECSVECKADGYIDETKNIYVPSYTSDWDCEIVISPDVGEGARIVLTWGPTPGDLDSHLVGNGIHVSFVNMNEGKASLDLDDRNGYGPETTTIRDLKGKYTFVVHDFERSGRLADSGAEVTVYLPGKQPETIRISGSGRSDTWVVFELNDGELNVINSIRDYDLGMEFVEIDEDI